MALEGDVRGDCGVGLVVGGGWRLVAGLWLVVEGGERLVVFVVISMGSNLSGSCGLVPVTSLMIAALSFVWILIMVASLSCSAADSCSSAMISIVVVETSPVCSSCRKPSNLVSTSSSSDAV